MRTTTRPSRAVAVCLTFGTLVWTGCSDPTTAPTRIAVPLEPQLAAARAEDVRAAIAAQERHNPALLRMPGVFGTAVGILPSGWAGVRVFVRDNAVRGVPDAVDDIPVAVQVTGEIIARSDPTTFLRPAPIGFSVGHPAITAGTMGAIVRNAAAQVFVLSNNHVLANQNDAAIGDPMLQPGPVDGGTLANQIGTLAAFQPINFSGGSNTIDAAIGSVTNPADVSNATPADDGYGLPNSKIFGDGNNDRVFDDKTALLTLNVQKYGRTTERTTGQITGINVTISVCYEVLVIFCLKSATFVDQLIIEPGAFSGGGDSGSLIVTNDANRNPVGLLFAGGSTSTIANRIDLVLNRFNVSVDGSEPQPPPDIADVAVTGVSAPSSVTQGATVNVAVTVRNIGTQDVGSFNVTLRDNGTSIGVQPVSGLATGATTTLNFSWNTTGAATGTHTLAASHDLSDGNATNNTASTTSTVNAPAAAGIHIGDLDGLPSNDGSTWSATVEITVHDANHASVNGATIVGAWSIAGLNANTCTSGDLGGTGTCVVLFPGLKKKTASVTFTVTSVTLSGQTYQSGANHDPDGSSNGTSIKVNKP